MANIMQYSDKDQPSGNFRVLRRKVFNPNCRTFSTLKMAEFQPPKRLRR